MYAVNMLSSINMELFEAFNPLYGIPIVAVILCAVIVYAFGFKSTVQPSFQGIEEEKKVVKKRKTKEVPKSAKLVQNGKVNGNAAKNNTVASKKKESTEKAISVDKDKSNNTEKVTGGDKKASKKAKAQTEKKQSQEKKKESFSHDEINDDGWVQLVSKKGRKNKKKEDTPDSVAQIVAAVTKTTEPSKTSVVHVEKQPPKKETEAQVKAVVDEPKQVVTTTKDKAKEKAVKDTAPVVSVEKPKLPVVTDVAKPDNNKIEKQPTKEPASEGAKVMESSSKSKKKKKKSESSKAETEPLADVSNKAPDSPAVQVITEAPIPKEAAKNATNLAIELPLDPTKKKEASQPLEIKTSNVAFDELAGLYPETKEQKKKKKVRRDH